MPLLLNHNFFPVDSTAPSFASTSGSSGLYVLASTAANRYWRHPSGRAVRVTSKASDDYSVQFGTSLTAVATTDTSMVILGGTVETFYIPSDVTYVAVKSSTDVIAQFTLGHGK